VYSYAYASTASPVTPAATPPLFSLLIAAAWNSYAMHSTSSPDSSTTHPWFPGILVNTVSTISKQEKQKNYPRCLARIPSVSFKKTGVNKVMMA
jgi:hypothetical protein